MARIRIVVIGFALVVSACGGSETTDSTAEPATTAAVVTTEAVTTTDAPATSAAVATTDAVTTTDAPATTVPAATGPQHVTFPTSDGVTLEGTIFGSGGDVVVLGAMGRSVMETWFPFAIDLADEGYTAFAYNMRGHGDSGGDQAPYRVDVDAQAAIDFMAARTDGRIFFFGASVNGVGAIAAGANNDLAGVVSLSGVDSVDDVDAVALAPMVDEPKLFIVASGDGPVPGLLQLVVDASGEPKEFVVLDGTAHGTDLFSTHGDELTALLLEFLGG